MKPIGLEDSTVFVVAGDTAIGRLVALHFVRAGSQRIGILGSDATRAEAAAQAVFAAASGMWAVAAAGDLSSHSDAQRMVAELSAALGDADVVVNCQPDSNEVVGDVVRRAMVDRGDAVLVAVGSRDTEPTVEDARIRTVAREAGCPPEELAAAMVKAAREAREYITARSNSSHADSDQPS
ncbi:SDR family NAD(P)-dependent oxidoreductase [Gordonia rhizosphera]|uniref:Oxidoreductase n=1 Tax=Gordonia rhizosphera NBRC 16068 TaxID=1108045 RepID=K6WA74_9ACTN|nr:SDR family oxidoreductase [Gordonia rhizosphera]GAB90656.1 hypothetical protein GORHZ_115_00100 [Gordonia rhizosphera NBRC 16068]